MYTFKFEQIHRGTVLHGICTVIKEAEFAAIKFVSQTHENGMHEDFDSAWPGGFTIDPENTKTKGAAQDWAKQKKP